MKWTLESDAPLQDLKTYFSSVPTLVSPKPQEPLLLYLAVTNQVVSAALATQHEVEETTASADVPPREERENKARRGGHHQKRRGEAMGKESIGASHGEGLFPVHD